MHMCTHIYMCMLTYRRMQTYICMTMATVIAKRVVAFVLYASLVAQPSANPLQDHGYFLFLHRHASSLVPRRIPSRCLGAQP